MKRITQTTLVLSALALTLAAAGCTTAGPPAANTAATNTAANTATAAATPSPTASPAGAGRAASELPVTLPVLDAMFADEAFAGELKSRLQLTDEQVTKLREVAREETGNLQEGDGEHSGTTTEATRRANAKVEEVLGRDKANAFSAFVRERWAGGAAEAAANSKPNTVPTDTRIVVNAPAYRMDVFEGGKLVKTYKVGIGYPEFPLPQGMRKADQIIFNPTWTPPDEPWVKGKFAPGKKVEAGSKDNPLGPIKIPIGLPSLIHGGKSAARLGTFASHGCVGLTNPQVQDFAVVLAKIGGAEVTPEDVKTYAQKREETKNVKLSSAVPVELRYETIVVEDGRLHVYRDVYDKDTNTEENLRRVLETYGVRLEDLTEQERAQVTQALRAMARDAQGNPTDGQPTPTPTPSKDKNANVRETKTIKGQKEMVIDIAALRGKGYPAPVNLDTGGAPQPKAAAKKKA
ncbi:MAG TPA: L,D-transpeptidase family protein [Pyrinomonadaceae bacterium]|nr:L,D-transpeptidase family protein [Pyrinomonadaceae bacterium]